MVQSIYKIILQNEDVINEIERKLAGINLEDAKKSSLQQNLDDGKHKDRKVAKGARKTQEGKERQAQSEEARRKEEAIIKATLKEKNEKDGGESEGWESVEEDFPHIKLDDLKDLQSQLQGMQIGDDDDDEDLDSDGEVAPAKGTKKEEVKKGSKPKK